MTRRQAEQSLVTIVDHQRLTVSDKLSLINLIDEGLDQSSDSNLVGRLFQQLGDLVDTTVKGAKIDRLGSNDARGGFKVFEINSETGENLGRLHMLYLKKPIPCYYLVYVEVAAPFRNKGLGNLVLRTFRSFLIEKSAIGMLDNIIPEGDPTYDIYLKSNWKPIQAVTGVELNGDGVYMVFVPPGMENKELREPVLKLAHHLKRKRAAIAMRDNELMVKRTIDEFKDIYAALLTYFGNAKFDEDKEILMRFMFTKFVTKLLGFGRRISELVGYTGGESLQQIVLDAWVRNLTAQSYIPRTLGGGSCFVTGDKGLWLALPESLKLNPAREIEKLPNYRRPKFSTWISARGAEWETPISIGDLLDLGFDPTRLKEIEIEGKNYIFERLQARMLPELEARKELLEKMASAATGVRLGGAELRVNAPLLIIRDRGNAYALRNKVDGIHWEEAVDQSQTNPSLADINKSMKLDKLITKSVKKAREWLIANAGVDSEGLIDGTSFFVSWVVETNKPKIIVDFQGSYIETLWIA